MDSFDLFIPPVGVERKSLSRDSLLRGAIATDMQFCIGAESGANAIRVEQIFSYMFPLRSRGRGACWASTKHSN
jgi:hypothetical protein